ncbi:rhodanese-like domain-containing protein [Desulfonatronovibrio hydrogenovorans]|uniref:rhodanese-like domain-containing protein n=1 Tax=Desulfonatronovibrio hydrogenovorans TaxID=53245 RepID=UPI0004913D9D|nr:rhodanese-like domain-containing protein [Desulfonatronovibrio hydrogenovorans]
MKTSRIKRIFPEDLKQFTTEHKEKEYVLVDVRLPGEYEQEHIPGARLIPLHELETRLTEIDQSGAPLFYCSSGKRSMAAATLARDSGLFSGEVFSLEGGISAYAGKVLPDYPRVDLFQGLDSSQDALKRAIALEKGAYRLYLGFMDRVQDEAIRTQLSRLASLEVSHARMIYSRAGGVFDQDFEALFDQADQDRIEGGLDPDSWLQQLDKVQPGDMCFFLLELALEMESMAYDMYRSLAEEDLPGELKECFFRLSEQEKSHMRLISRIFRDCPGQTDQADYFGSGPGAGPV